LVPSVSAYEAKSRTVTVIGATGSDERCYV
jgi:hypothetical protein